MGLVHITYISGSQPCIADGLTVPSFKPNVIVSFNKMSNSANYWEMCYTFSKLQH